MTAMEEDTDVVKTSPVSIVWKYFQKFYPEKQGSRIHVQCQLCRTALLYHNTTTTMLRHLKKKHISEITEPQLSSENPMIEEKNGEWQGTQPLGLGPWGSSIQSVEVPDGNGSSSTVSIVWKYFQKIYPKRKGSRVQVQCQLCRANFLYHKTTTNMLRHLKKKHKQEIPELQQPSSKTPMIEENVECKPELQGSVPWSQSIELTEVPDANGSSPKKKQRTITSFASSPPYLQTSALKKRRDTFLVRMVAVDVQPFCIVEDKGFQDFVKCLDPRYQLPSKKTLKAMMQNECDAVVVTCKEKLKAISSVSITTDSWTTINNDSFLAITCHFFTGTFELKSWLIDICRMTENHTPENVLQILQKTFVDWDIENKVVCVTTDNAYNVATSVQGLNLSHVDCYARTINLVVTQSIEAIPNLKLVKDKLKAIVTHFKNSSSTKEKFEKAQLSLNHPVKKLVQDVDTRWNSLYMLMQRCIEVREALDIVLAESDDLQQLLPIDWKIAEECIKVLQPFFTFTEEMCTDKSVLVSLVIPITRLLQKATVKLADEYERLYSGDDGEENPARALAMKLNQELTAQCGDVEANRIYGIATLLDPRFKTIVFANVGKLEAAIQQVQEEAYQIGQLNQQAQAAPVLISEANHTEAEAPSTCSIWSDFDEEVCRQVDVFENYGARIDIEMQSYFAMKNIPRSESPSAFWKANEHKFPTLAVVARKYLCAQGTSVPSQRLVSKCGELISTKRSRLKESNVRACMVLSENK